MLEVKVQVPVDLRVLVAVGLMLHSQSPGRDLNQQTITIMVELDLRMPRAPGPLLITD
jgi:hypothetical protein